MPFKSEAQRRFLWMKYPRMAKRWSRESGMREDMPMPVRKKAKLSALKKMMAMRH